MAGFGGFLQGLGLAYGNSLIQGVNFEQKQAQADLMKTEAQQAQMQAQQMQQQMKTHQDIGAFLKSQTDLEGADALNPANQAKMYTKAAGLAASQGDLASAQEMSGLARQAQQDAIEQTKVVATQQAQKKELLANTAANVPDNPTREQSLDLMRKAVDAGVDPTTIPTPGTPAFLAWKNQQQLAGMDSKSRAEFLEKAADTKARREEQWQIHADNVDLKRAQMQQTAQFRDLALGLRKEDIEARKERGPQIIDIGGRKAEFDPNGTLKGERNPTDPRYVFLGDQPLTAQQRGGVSRLNEAVGEGARALTNMASFDVSSRASPFAHLGAHTPYDAFIKTGAQALTPDQAQMMNVTGANLGNQIGSAEAAFGGRMPNGMQQEHIEQATTPSAGDSGFTAAYKLANGKEIFETVLKFSPKQYRDSDDAKEHMRELSKINWTTQDVIQAAKKAADGGKSLQTIGDLGHQTAQIHREIAENMKKGSGSEEPLPGGGDIGAGTSAPPIPADIQSLVDKYRSK